jgi:hypothetical protein
MSIEAMSAKELGIYLRAISKTLDNIEAAVGRLGATSDGTVECSCPKPPSHFNFWQWADGKGIDMSDEDLMPIYNVMLRYPNRPEGDMIFAEAVAKALQGLPVDLAAVEAARRNCADERAKRAG